MSLSMATWLAPWMVVVISLRSVPSALLRPISLAAIHPRLGPGLRATYLSVQSLAGRLAFSVSLAVAGWALGGEGAITVDVMNDLLRAFAAGGAGLLAVLALGARAVSRNARG